MIPRARLQSVGEIPPLPSGKDSVASQSSENDPPGKPRRGSAGRGHLNRHSRGRSAIGRAPTA